MLAGGGAISVRELMNRPVLAKAWLPGPDSNLRPFD